MSMLVDNTVVIEQLTETDNRVLFMDIFGSWMEVGMVAAALLVGVAFVWMSVRKQLKTTLLKSNSKFLKMPDTCRWASHTRIHETLTELRVKCDGARTQIVQFHNGGHFLDGISMTKMTLTHESLRNGISSEFHIKKDLLLSMCVDGLTLLTKDLSTLHITEELGDSWCKQLLQNSNVISFTFLPLRKHNQVIGYVMCQWCSLSKVDGIDELDCSEEMHRARNLIEVQLEQENRRKRRHG